MPLKAWFQKQGNAVFDQAWIFLAAIYWVWQGLLWIPISRELFGPSGFLPRPEYNFSQLHFPWLGWDWLSDSRTVILPAGLILGGIFLLTRLSRVGAGLIWLILVVMLNRNNMIESAEWPLWGALLLSWALFGLRSPLCTWVLWLSFALFSWMAGWDQLSQGGWFFSPGLKLLLQSTFMTFTWAESFVQTLPDFFWSIVSTLILLAHLTSPILIWFKRGRLLAVAAFILIQIGALLLLDFSQITLGFLIWALVLLRASGPLLLAKEFLKNPKWLVPALIISLLVAARPLWLWSPLNTPGPAKTLALSPLQYPFGRPFKNEGYEGRVSILLGGPEGERTVQNDQALFADLAKYPRKRIFVFNSLATFHRMNPGLLQQILVQAFCSQGLLKSDLSLNQNFETIKISRKHLSGSAYVQEFTCPNS
jgi:hypothetical protein